ncbi:MAG TPA: lysophospholipid acyltransferase family protein [Pyrinomonadaceae bacterium]|nr:lysophospholipid acyltransferase family protein [Pyrinomonadaceae bacterium]
MTAPVETKRGAAASSGGEAGDERARRADEFADLSRYTARERLLIRAADLAFYLVIRAVGATVRFRVEGGEHWDEATRDGRLPVHTFWHDRLFLGTYFFRRRRIVVMTSRSFDGEYIARFIQRFGYGAARGSSTRGGVGALVEMVRLVRRGRAAAFSIDGPRGPRHVAKMGALLVAKKTGQPVLPFSLDARRFVTLPSWDRTHIPLPFTTAVVRFAPPIHVPADADDAQLAAKREELQRALDSVTDR